MLTIPKEPARVRKFRNWKLGLVIHWGVYAVPARGEWLMYNERIPHAEYRRFAEDFCGERFDPAAWARCAKQAGMKYMVLTARHHDGFSLFDSRVSDFTSAKTAAARDFVAEYIEACRAAGLGVGLYYSLIDWRYRAAFAGIKGDRCGWNRMVDYVHAQVEELCTHYGKLDILWYDGGGGGPEAWRARELNAMVRKHQPDILINNRSGLPEDFDTPEQQLDASPRGRMWESCFTMNNSWGFNRGDHDWKPLRQVLQKLAVCAGHSGNLLLNVGPRANGSFPPESLRIMEGVGKWIGRHKEWLYDTEGQVLRDCRNPLFFQYQATIRRNTVYYFAGDWPGGSITLAGAATPVRRAWVLATGKRCKVEQRGDRIFLDGLPRRAPDSIANVIALDFTRKPMPAPQKPLGEI